MARGNRNYDYHLPPQAHTCPDEGGEKYLESRDSFLSRPKPCSVLVPLLSQSLPSHSFDKGTNVQIGPCSVQREVAVNRLLSSIVY